VCCHAECCYAECRYAECRFAECCYAECRYAECRYAACCYADCYSAVIIFFKRLNFIKFLKISLCLPSKIYDTPKCLINYFQAI
jgi:hypothetical protein